MTQIPDQKITPGFNDESALTRPDAMSEAEYAQAFAAMARDYFTGRAADDPPHLYYVTGLPGAGKSTFITQAKQDRPEFGDYLHVNFDELRVYHPRYAEHVTQDPVNAAARIDTAVERLIGWLTEEAARRHLNVLLDDAAMGKDITQAIMAPFQSNGYDIEAAAIAVPSSIARQSVHLRFEENFVAAKSGAAVVPRWVNTTEQDNAPAALVETVEAVEAGIARHLTIVSRDGKVLYHNGSTGAGDAVKAEMTRELTDTEQADYQRNADRIAVLMQRRESIPGRVPQENRKNAP